MTHFVVKKLKYDGSEHVIGYEELSHVEEEYMSYLLKHLQEGFSQLDEQSVSDLLLSPSFDGNGCGAPGDASYPWIPNQPFLSACNGHDICYASFVNKST